MTTQTKVKPQAGKRKPGKFGPYQMPKLGQLVTHEALVHAVYGLAIVRANLTEDERTMLREIKLSYGAGPDGVRGITYYSRWQKPCACGHVHGPDHGHGKVDPKPKCNHAQKPQIVPFVAVCATGQESTVQVIGTTLHELGHVLAGPQAGHGPEWHAACKRLGLIGIQAAGTAYDWDNFEEGPWRAVLQALPEPNDGRPTGPVMGAGGLLGLLGMLGKPVKLKPCTAGYGTRGGKSRGAGSGSRLLLWQCGCEVPFKVRLPKTNKAGLEPMLTCGHCGEAFKVVEDGPDDEPPAGPQGPVEPKPNNGPLPVAGPAAGQPAAPAARGKGHKRTRAQAQKTKGKRRSAPLPKGHALAVSQAVNAPLPASSAKPAVGPVSGPGKPEDPLPF